MASGSIRQHPPWISTTLSNTLSRYQDTILAQSGNQFYASCYIEGAVDYIFGQEARAFFHQSTIASIGAGAITANGRDSDDGESLCK